MPADPTPAALTDAQRADLRAKADGLAPYLKHRITCQRWIAEVGWYEGPPRDPATTPCTCGLDAALAAHDALAARLAEVEGERDRWYGKALERVVERNQAEARAEALAGALGALVEAAARHADLCFDHDAEPGCCGLHDTLAQARALLAPAPADASPALPGGGGGGGGG